MNQAAAEADSCCASLIVIIAQINFHCGLLRGLRLVRIWRNSEDVDLLVEARVLVEVLVEATIPALAALVGLLRVVARLVQIVLIYKTRAGVDYLSSRAGDSIDAGWDSVRPWTHLPISRLSLIHVVCSLVSLRCCRSLYDLVVDRVKAAFLQASGTLVRFHLTLSLVLRLCRSLVEQVVGAGLGVLG